MSAAAAKPLVLWGATGQAIVLAEFVERLGFRIVALFDNDPQATSPLPDVAVHRGESFEAWRRNHHDPLYGIVAIGGARGSARLEIGARFESSGIALATVAHPAAYVAGDARLGPGSQVLAGAVICARARIGRCVIVNTRASIDHECEIGAGSHIGPGTTLAGCVRVAEEVFVGSGAVVLPRIAIGKAAIVGAGAVVTRDVPEGAVVAGNPARIIRKV